MKSHDPLNPSHMPPVAQKHPNDRAHFWDYANPHMTETPAPLSRDFPRAVHRTKKTKAEGEDLSKAVEDERELAAALAEGWALQPVVEKA